MCAFMERWHVPPEAFLELPVSRKARMLRWGERHQDKMRALSKSKDANARMYWTTEDMEYIWGRDLYDDEVSTERGDEDPDEE